MDERRDRPPSSLEEHVYELIKQDILSARLAQGTQRRDPGVRPYPRRRHRQYPDGTIAATNEHIHSIQRDYEEWIPAETDLQQAAE
jgi:hypothetical protein